ncbi:hypothetical protein TSUD_236000 [Trifolium subterraneum]|nr:hypothetical protein TSUD_236000 [Trifolium subterraneum]
MLSFTSFTKLSYQQKSRATWLREGTCFHGRISRTSKENEMLYLEMNSNRVAGIDAIFEHFKTQFHAKRGNRPVLERFNFKRIEAEDNVSLIDVFSEEEVRNAVWDCESLKSPGPDGVDFEFVKEFWEDIKLDFLRVMTEFHTSGRLVKGVNCSFVVLVPKKYNPVEVPNFRRVSLVGCIYKVISKVLANRLECVIGSVISKPQSIIVDGREITDGVRIANEYLDYVMEKMGFDVRWREWISECLKAASISALVNGSPIEEFEMSCGLRQEDPLSPFLFLIAIESFNLMMRKTVELGKFSDAVRNRLSGWKNKHLTIGGRAVIIKSLLSGLLVYFLSSRLCQVGEVNIVVEGLRWSRELTQQELVSLNELKEVTEKVELKVKAEDKCSWVDGMSKIY